jgi:hypothetical protein
VALDRQVALESYALWRITGKPVRTIRYRFVRKPSIKQKQNETVNAYIERLEADYVERRDDFYTEEETDVPLRRRPVADGGRAVGVGGAAAQRAPDRGVYARNTDSCGDYGGCAFLPLCLGDPDARSLYRQKTDPPKDSKVTE